MGRSAGPRPAGSRDTIDGVLLVDKPMEWTSHDVVARLRNRFRLRKVGHGGTLDPMATGLLIILLGRGTKLSERLMATDKSYEGTMRLGVSTDTHDADGRVVREADAGGISEEALRREMQKWTGDVMQTPPMVSAIKKDGVPLYKLARKGKTVERKPRLLHIYTFELLAYRPPEATFRLTSTKGTYVRTLCHDVGDALGCGAHLSRLRRLKCGRFDVSTATPLDTIVQWNRDELAERVIPVSTVAAGEPVSR